MTILFVNGLRRQPSVQAWDGGQRDEILKLRERQREFRDDLLDQLIAKADARQTLLAIGD